MYAFGSLYKPGDILDFYDIDDGDALGEGGFSIVRKGTKKDTGESFAIKIIDKQNLSEAELDNLHNELRILSILDHPNIVKVFEYYECDDIVFIVMEIMLGGEMFDRIVKYQHYTEKQAADTFRPIVDAVRYCHSIGVVHRDLKPENLLYQSNDNKALIKVSDFGLAKYMINDKEMLFTACGTPNYVAPEIIRGEGYEDKVDCWSLGVILYVMLCGFPPFYDEDNEKLFDQIKSGELEFPSPHWDTISESAKDLINKLICIDPTKRLSAAEILKHPWLSVTQNNTTQLPFNQERFEGHRSKLRNAILATILIGKWARTLKK